MKYIVLFFVVLVSCKEATKDVIKSTKVEPILEGKYYDIKNYPVKLFLPMGYKPIERSQLLKEAQNIENDFMRKQLVKSLEFQIQNKIDKQYLFSEFDGSVVSFTEIPYMPLNVNVAGQILGIFEMQNQSIYENTPMRRLLVDKGFKSNKSLKIFKAIYKNESVENNENLGYLHLYMIELKNKLYIINLEVGEEVFFEPYLAKTRVL
jgi:hypothetical protein